MAKVTPVLWKYKENGDGHAPIYLRISVADEVKYKSTGTYIHPRHWNERLQRVRRGHTKSDEINALLSKLVSKAEGIILERKRHDKPITASHIKAALSSDGNAYSGDFFAFADKVVRDFKRQGKIHTHRRYKSICKKFRKFAGAPLPFENLTVGLLEDFETHLVDHYGNARSTIASNFRAIRAILYRAIRAGHAKQEQNPFFQFTVKRPKPKRERLSYDQIKSIEALGLEEESLIWHVRNYFLFSFYCAGVRFTDMATMQRKHVREGRLIYTMSKTGQEKNVKLLPQAREILGHYAHEDMAGEDRLFPILDGYDVSTPTARANAIGNQNALVNKYLKKIAKRAEIDCKLSFHMARHSFADFARQSGMDLYDISKALGHSSIKQTETYLDGFDTASVDDAMDELFND